MCSVKSIVPVFVLVSATGSRGTEREIHFRCNLKPTEARNPLLDP